MADTKSPRNYPMQETGSTDVNPTGSGKESDKLTFNENLKPSRPAIPSAEEALKLAEKFVAANKARVDRDAYIYRQYDNAPPMDNEALRQSGSGWMSNISAGFLAAFMARVVPSFRKAVNATKFITSAGIEGETDKSLKFQELFTKMIRSWSGWQNLLDDIFSENTLLGRAVLRFPDEYTLKPKFYTTSNALLPESCSQNIDEIPYIVFCDDWQIHEFIDMIKDKEVKEVNGWDLDNCVKALNGACKDERSRDIQRAYEDWISQGAYSYSFAAATQSAPNKVLTYTIVAQEPDEDGMISEMMITRSQGEKKGGLQLYYKKNKYKKMSDCCSLYCYTRQNGTAHGSKGLGRIILNHHEAFNRMFNQIINNTFLSGQRVVTVPERQKVDLSLKVRGPFMIQSPGMTSEPANVNVNVDSFYAIVRQITGMAEQTAGAYVPATLLPNSKTDKTATEATIEAAEQAEIKEGVMGRFLNQFTVMVWTQQRRALDPENPYKEVKEFQKLLKELGLTKDDFKEIAESNPFEHIIDYSSSARNAKIANFYGTIGRGNPAFDQAKLARMIADVLVDTEFADEVVLVTTDPSVDADAIRMQDLETSSMLSGSGIYIPISPVDNDLAHLGAIQQALTDLMTAQPVLDQNKLIGLQNLIKHAGAHIEAAKAKNVPSKDITPFERFLKVVVKQLQEYVANLERVGREVAKQLPGQLGGQTPALPTGEVPANPLAQPAGAI